MEENKKVLKKQITELAANVQYTYMAHWVIVNRLNTQYLIIKIIQIVLTALSTGGFMASIMTSIPQFSWVGGLTSAMALGINLYMLNFRISDIIKQHTDAANELWEVKEKYKSLLVDFECIGINDIRKNRDVLIMDVSRINKAYPGTTAKSFKQSQKNLAKYQFDDGEAAFAINMENGNKK